MYNIAVIGGDGIGKEVMSACEYLLEKIDIEFSFTYGHAGFECFNKTGTTLPEKTIKIAKVFTNFLLKFNISEKNQFIHENTCFEKLISCIQVF